MTTSKIEFFIPSDEKIPTALRLKVDGKLLTYKPEDALTYDFTFYGNWTRDEAEEAIKRIAELMECQSEDFGSKWRIVSIDPSGLKSYRVKFRIVDSY